MNIGLWLLRMAQVQTNRAAVFHGHCPVADYGGFHTRAAQTAAGLKARGTKPGDRVALFMENNPDYLMALFGCWYAGAVAVPINARLHAKEAAWILEDAGARICLTSAAQMAALEGGGMTCRMLAPSDVTSTPVHDAPTRRAPDDLAWLFYTSGTTGRPKGVQITHRMLAAMTLSYLSDVDEVTAGDATIYAAPMSHGAGLYSLVHVLRGARHVVPVSGRFDPGEILDLAAHFGRGHLFAAPTMVKRLTAHARAQGLPGTGLRSVIYGGGPMYLADITEAVEQFGPVLIQIYGQGEAPMAITALSRADVADRAHPRWRDRLGSVGRAQSMVELRIGDGLPPGEMGEIMVRGDLVMPGYWQNAAATSQTLRDGWLRTGDIGRLDADGYLTLMDRSKDMIVSGGQNIYPREVEDVLLRHPGVAQASVVGRASDAWGEEVVAFVVATGDPPDPADLDVHCLSQMARFKRPKAYILVGDLPRNAYGKVLKSELRARLPQTGPG